MAPVHNHNTICPYLVLRDLRRSFHSTHHRFTSLASLISPPPSRQRAWLRGVARRSCAFPVAIDWVSNMRTVHRRALLDLRGGPCERVEPDFLLMRR